MTHYMMRLVAASEKQVDNLPLCSAHGRQIRATLVQAAFVNLGHGHEMNLHLAGYVLPGRVRLTSKVVGYDPKNLLVETNNSLYRICAPVGEADQDLLNAVMIIAVGMGENPISTPAGLN